MTEYGIHNIETGKERIIFGYTLADAFRRADMNPAEWKVDYAEYVD